MEYIEKIDKKLHNLIICFKKIKNHKICKN